MEILFMQSEKKSFFGFIENYIDMIINALSIYIAYFFTCLIDKEPPIDVTAFYTVLTVLSIAIITSFIYQACNVYKPVIVFKFGQSYGGILRGNVTVFTIMTLLLMLFAKDGTRTFLMFWAMITFAISTAFLIFKRRLILAIITMLRKKQYILRKTIIVGDNTLAAKEYVSQIANNPGYGVMILGYVGDKIDADVGCDKLGSFRDLVKILDEYKPTDVVFAIDSYDKRHLIRLVNLCDDRCIKVFFLPVIYGFFKNSRQIEQIGSIPIINIHTTPLDNRGHAALKRTMDIVGSLALILLTLPLMIFAAIGTKLTSEGPILFKQRRVGKMGKYFTMLKFRSMPVNKDAEDKWTVANDARPTKFGSFLRRTAIDELPQFFNVLVGQMSLVGPRPEIPKFVEAFKETVPLYMIKHYVKPGVTGLAQIRGLRGDTSIEERIHVDISYIENWSLWLDISILLRTPFKAFNKNERYVDKSEVHIAKEESTEAESPLPKPKKILYAASTASHLRAFHTPYIDKLTSEGHIVKTMARGEGVDFNIPFEKKFLSKKNRELRSTVSAIIEREKFDLIILNTSLAAFHIRLAVPKRDRPRIVNVVHGYLFPEEPRGLKDTLRAKMLLWAEKLLTKKTDAILTMNEEDFRIATSNALTCGTVIPTFGMGVPYPKFKLEEGELRRKFAGADDYVLLFVGELSARKNQEFLIRELPKIKERIPNVRLWLVGAGDEEKHLKALSETLDVTDRVVFFGKRKNPADFMRDCDLYVSPSASEGLPFNIVEALGSGKVVLATDIKGHSDILADGVGVLFNPNIQGDFEEKLMDIHDGRTVIPESKLSEGYRNFSEAVVFLDTYEKLKGACEL